MNKTSLAIVEAFTRGYRVTKRGQVMSPQGRIRALRKTRDPNRVNYYKVTVNLDGVSRPISVHRLVAYQKFGDKLFTPGLEVRHRNGDPSDNRPDNILLGTGTDNAFDRTAEARRAHAQKAAEANRKFGPDVVSAMRKMRAAGATLQAIKEKFGCSLSTASLLVRVQTLKNL